MRKLILVVAIVAACGGKKDKPATGAAHDAGGAPVATTDGGGAKVAATDGGGGKVAATDGGAAKGKRLPLVARAQVDALLTAWLDAQNNGDFAAYQALYATAFKGVRRSGKQTVRLDHDGWLKDRKKMFARPMLVAARDVEITLGEGRATAEFVQEWSSGKYHDVGPKVLEVVVDGSNLLISREELLTSKIVKPGKPPAVSDAPAPMWLVLDKQRIVVSSEVVADWASGKPRLVSGEIPERDPSCDDDPPDYEDDAGRYWDCEASDPDRGHGEFEATQPIDGKAVPAAFMALVGKEVRITGEAGKTCTAKIDHLELYAWTETTFASATAGGDDDASIAETVMDGAPVLAANLAGGCAGWFAQLATTPAAPLWTTSAATPAIEKAVHKWMTADGMDSVDTEDVAIQVVTGPDGKQLVLAERGEMWCYGIHQLTMVFPFDGKKVGEPILDESDEADLLGLADLDGDGHPELVFTDGFGLYRDDSYEHVLAIDFADDIEEECGE